MQQQPPQGPYPPQGTYPPPNQPYGPPQGAAPRGSGIALASMICALAGIVPCFFLIPSITGLILGIVAVAKINRSNGALTGKGKALAGIIVSLLFMVVWPIAGYAIYNYMDGMIDECVDQIDAHLKAIDEGDYKTAYEMYSEKDRANMSYDKFVEGCKADKENNGKYLGSSFNLFDENGGFDSHSGMEGTFMALRVKAHYSKRGDVPKIFYLEYRDGKWMLVPKSRTGHLFDDFERE